MLPGGVDSWCHSRCVRRFPVFIRWGKEVCYAGDGWGDVGGFSFLSPMQSHCYFCMNLPSDRPRFFWLVIELSSW